MIRSILWNSIIISSLALSLLYIFSVPLWYIGYLFIFVSIWVIIGLLGGWRLSSHVLRLGKIPIYMLSWTEYVKLKPESMTDKAEKILISFFQPSVHIKVMSLLTGLIFVGIVLSRQSLRGSINFIIASFSIGLIAGVLQGTIMFIMPYSVLYFLERTKHSHK